MEKPITRVQTVLEAVTNLALSLMEPGETIRESLLLIAAQAQKINTAIFPAATIASGGFISELPGSKDTADHIYYVVFTVPERQNPRERKVHVCFDHHRRVLGSTLQLRGTQFSKLLAQSKVVPFKPRSGN